MKKKQEAENARALWKMKAAKDAGEGFHDPEREDNILARNKTRSALWKEHLKGPMVALDKALNCVEILYQRSRPQCLAEGCLVMAGLGFIQSLWEKPIWEGVWLCLDWIVCVCAQRPRKGMRQGSMGRMASFFFFLFQKEPATEPIGETFSPFYNADIRTPLFSADVLKKCALFALHIIAEEGRDGDGFQVPGLGDEWKMVCPKSPMWESALAALVKAMYATMRLQVVGLHEAW